jgi:hypothetical protein
MASLLNCEASNEPLPRTSLINTTRQGVFYVVHVTQQRKVCLEAVLYDMADARLYCGGQLLLHSV